MKERCLFIYYRKPTGKISIRKRTNTHPIIIPSDFYSTPPRVNLDLVALATDIINLRKYKCIYQTIQQKNFSFSLNKIQKIIITL